MATKKQKAGNVPNLRFSGFEGEWEKTNLKDCSISLDYGMNAAATNYDGDNKYIRITDIDEHSSKYVPNPIVSPEGKLFDDHLVQENDILFARTGASTGKSYLYDVEDGKLYFAGFLIRARIKDAYNSRFIFLQTQTETYKRWVKLMSMRSGQPGINSKEYSNYTIAIPSRKEQDKIAYFFRLIDSRIATQNKIIEKLETLIKGLRDILLSQSLRFIGFNKDWNTVHIGDDCEVLMCKRIFADQTSKFGEIPFYKIGTLGNIPDSYIERALFDEYVTKYRYPIKGEVLITCSGTVGKCLRFDGQDAYFQDSNIVWIDNPKLKFSNEFLYYTLSNIQWGELNSTTITRIYGSDLRELKITYPTEIDEQQKITTILSSLDEKIRTENALLKQYELQKKYMLRNLFI